MNVKWIGAVCVVISCGGWGFLMALQHINKVRILRNFLSILDYMECELQYRATVLPNLCRQAGDRAQGILRQVFRDLSDELEAQIAPNAKRCMASVLAKTHGLDPFLVSLLSEFSENLGIFDVAGQVKGFAHTRQLCQTQLEVLLENKESRLRSYQTLGLCIGAAIAILLV